MPATVVRGETTYEGAAGEVRILSDIGLDRPEDVARAAFDFAARLIEERRDAVLDDATAVLRTLYNETWRDEDAPELDEAAFRAALTVDTVSITELENPSFLVSVYLECGELFAGHAIEVMLEKNGSLFGQPHLVG